MSRETKKSTVASHFQKVDGEGYVCQIEKNGDVCRTKLKSKLFNLKVTLKGITLTFSSLLFKKNKQRSKQLLKKAVQASNRRFQNTFRVKKLLGQ